MQRTPKIGRDEFAELAELMTAFDTLTFNTFGEAVVTLRAELPIVRDVTISYLVRERHLAIYPAAGGDALLFIDTFTETGSRERVITAVRRKIAALAREHE